MSRTVLIKKMQLHGNLPTLHKATVMAALADGMLRVIPEGSNKPIVVKASEVTDAPTVFGGREALRRGAVVHRVYPDSRNSLHELLQQRGF